MVVVWRGGAGRGREGAGQAARVLGYIKQWIFSYWVLPEPMQREDKAHGSRIGPVQCTSNLLFSLAAWLHYCFMQNYLIPKFFSFTHDPRRGLNLRPNSKGIRASRSSVGRVGQTFIFDF